MVFERQRTTTLSKAFCHRPTTFSKNRRLLCSVTFSVEVEVHEGVEQVELEVFCSSRCRCSRPRHKPDRDPHLRRRCCCCCSESRSRCRRHRRSKADLRPDDGVASLRKRRRPSRASRILQTGRAEFDRGLKTISFT
jgi:hypothetical protein